MTNNDNRRTKEEVMADMGNAAVEAEVELRKMVAEATIDKDSLHLVAEWWKRNYLKAGHKRLGRVLLMFTSD